MAVALVLAVLLGWWHGRDDGSLQRIRESGVLRIGYAVEAPYAYLSGTGAVIGESPATARLIAAAMGVERLEWVLVPFSHLIADLQEGRFDLIAAGLFITEERGSQVRFSSPVLAIRSGVLLRRGEQESLRERLLTAMPVPLAVLEGAVEHQWAVLRPEFGPGLVVVPDALSGQVAVASREVDALALSWPATRLMAAAAPATFEAMLLPGAGETVNLTAFAFRPRDLSLQQAWERAQRQVIGSSAHLAAIAPYGFSQVDLAVGKETAD
ncbi:transporter substrate-binding domain-containing protein [Zobellella denitrificans]|uniref:transporter substrate-binding domain-containing protein n=1 Tax=Zobellella denitrificans TaxID=347534 RepID=UPI0015954447|nr:transporter substrate-binding domain-containing protein [Zobellella denitrificans]